jgi:phosphate-selective porin OprO/OprP
MKKLSFAIIIMMFSLSLLAQESTDTIRYNQYGVPVHRNPLAAEERDGIIVFESPNQNFKFWFDLRVQMDGAAFFGKRDYMDPIGNGVTNRRTRIGIKSQISKDWYGEIDTDFANGNFELKDALLSYTGLSDWIFSAGNFKEDFSMEETTSSRYIPFIERPMAVQTFAPSRHLGLDARYSRNWFYGSAGVFFQAIEGAETALFVEDNNKDYGRNQGLSYTAKVVFHPLYKYDDRALHIGMGGSYRTPKTDMDVTEHGGVRYSTRNNTAINRKKYIDTDVIPNVDHDLLGNIELAGYYKGLRLQGEYIFDNVYIKDNAPANVNKETKNFKGWYAMAGYLLFGGQQRYNSHDAEFTQPGRGRKWGDVELLFRYDYLNLNSKNIYGGSGENYTLGLNYYINKSVKVALNYLYTKDDRYANGKGKLFVGRDAAGNPTSNFKEVVAAKGDAGIRYSMLGVRFEIDF